MSDGTADSIVDVTRPLKVAVVQHNAGTDVERNLSTLETLSKQAASEGAQDSLPGPKPSPTLGQARR